MFTTQLKIIKQRRFLYKKKQNFIMRFGEKERNKLHVPTKLIFRWISLHSRSEFPFFCNGREGGRNEWGKQFDFMSRINTITFCFHACTTNYKQTKKIYKKSCKSGVKNILVSTKIYFPGLIFFSAKKFYTFMPQILFTEKQFSVSGKTLCKKLFIMQKP